MDKLYRLHTLYCCINEYAALQMTYYPGCTFCCCFTGLIFIDSLNQCGHGSYVQITINNSIRCILNTKTAYKPKRIQTNCSQNCLPFSGKRRYSICKKTTKTDRFAIYFGPGTQKITEPPFIGMYVPSMNFIYPKRNAQS